MRVDYNMIIHLHLAKILLQGPPPKRQRIAQLATRFIESFNDKMDALMTHFGKIADKCQIIHSWILQKGIWLERLTN